MAQEIRKTTVIICEGSVTEPNYFHGLSKIINDAEGRARIIIKPKPPLQKEAEIRAVEEAHQNAIDSGEIPRTTRRKRTARAVDVEPDIPVIPTGFTAQPVNYVWQAQQELQIHEEAWAVFDLDGHAEQKRAFDLAEEAVLHKKVNTAFSSISFETWILLHFECYTAAFAKSQCRTQKKPHDCGQGTHPNDCNGATCVTGYMKVKGYIPKNDDVKKTSYQNISDKTLTAIENSLTLRNQCGNPIDCYNYNPITTVDRLTFKLLYIDDDYKWISCKDLEKYHLSYSTTGQSIYFKFTNKTNAKIIVKSTFIQLCNLDNKKRDIIEREVLEIGESLDFKIDLEKIVDFRPRFLVLENEDDTKSIIEIQNLL